MSRYTRFVSFALVALLLIGCSELQTYSKEDKIYNPPYKRGSIPKPIIADVNQSLSSYCSEIAYPYPL